MKTLFATLAIGMMMGCVHAPEKPKEVNKPVVVTNNHIEWNSAGTVTTVQPVPKPKSLAVDADSPSCHCDPEALDYAVLDRIGDIGLQNYSSSTVDIDGTTKQDVALEMRQIKQVRDWAGKLKDRCIREKFLRWMDFYEDDAKEAMKEIATKAEKKESDSWYEKAQRQMAEAKRCERKGMIPTPPEGKP